MSEHHVLPVTLEELYERFAHGDHSIFAPSGADMWMICAGSLIPNLLAEDTSGEDAAEGTVAHYVGEQWLKHGRPYHLLGRVAVVTKQGVRICEPNITIDECDKLDAEYAFVIDELMFSYVEEYVSWCATQTGDHFIEQRLDFSHLTPIPNQKGTSDHVCVAPGILTITDLKFGKGIQVYAKDNRQLRIYALAAFEKYDFEYDIQTIRIRVCQPRLEHYDEWTISREELLAFAEEVREAAVKAWKLDAPRTPEPKACQWCRVKTTCSALAAWMADNVDSAFDDLTYAADKPAGEYPVPALVEVRHRVESGHLLGRLKNPAELTTAELAKLKPYRKLVEAFFKEVDEELLRRAPNEDIPGFKLAQGREGNREWRDEAEARAVFELNGIPPEKYEVTTIVSPAQADELLRAATGLSKKKVATMFASSFVRAAGKPVLVPLSDEREALDQGDAFDDYTVVPEDEI